jgi:hypothetical protein
MGGVSGCVKERERERGKKRRLVPMRLVKVEACRDKRRRRRGGACLLPHGTLEF